VRLQHSAVVAELTLLRQDLLVVLVVVVVV
jgi:hypothetical protein